MNTLSKICEDFKAIRTAKKQAAKPKQKPDPDVSGKWFDPKKYSCWIFPAWKAKND